LKTLLIVYDNESYIHWFPQGLGYIAAALLRQGHTVEVYSQDLHHCPEEHLTAYLDNEVFDVVGVGVIAGYFQYRKLLQISAAINQARRRPHFLIGGHGPSPEPEYFLRKTGADAAVLGEGEETILELIDALGDPARLAEVKGIAYRDGDEVRVNERRRTIKDIDSLPLPAFHLFPIEYYRLLRPPHVRKTDFVMPVLSGRGCTYRCNFCYRMDKGYRPRSNESIIEEIRLLKRDYRISYVIFSDELLMSSVKRTVSLCEAMLAADLDIIWDCNGRLNNADPEVLDLMKRAGRVFINYGIEAFDDQVLENMRKSLTTEQVIKGVEATLTAGISPGLNIIFGNIGDNRRTLEKGVEFLLKYRDLSQMRTIRPVTPYPGSPLYYQAIEKGLLKGCEDFYENKHTNSDLLAVNFTDLSDQDFHACLLDANARLIEDYYHQMTQASVAGAKKLYLDQDPNFRGFRQQ